MRIIDGSQGEGGGQVLRTTLALSLVTGEPVRIVNIRAGRPKPGLQRQHLAAVRAAAEIGHAEVSGAELRSSMLTFAPRGLWAGTYRFAVGSAGSTTLVAQTVLPALLRAAGPSELVFEGGTHNPLAPPFDFFATVFLGTLRSLGVEVDAQLERHGFAPAGGGRFSLRLGPARLRRMELVERGALVSAEAVSTVAGVPGLVGRRERDTLLQLLDWPPERGRIAQLPDQEGPGNVLVARLGFEHATEVITGFGERGVSAENVARRVADEVRAFLAADVPVGEHLADQLLLPLALSEGGVFRTTPLSGHATTQIALLRDLLGVETTVVPDRAGSVLVRVEAMRRV